MNDVFTKKSMKHLKMSEYIESVNFSVIPSDCIRDVCSHLDNIIDISSLSQTCKRFNQVINLTSGDSTKHLLKRMYQKIVRRIPFYFARNPDFNFQQYEDLARHETIIAVCDDYNGWNTLNENENYSSSNGNTTILKHGLYEEYLIETSFSDDEFLCEAFDEENSRDSSDDYDRESAIQDDIRSINLTLLYGSCISEKEKFNINSSNLLRRGNYVNGKLEGSLITYEDGEIISEHIYEENILKSIIYYINDKKHNFNVRSLNKRSEIIAKDAYVNCPNIKDVPELRSDFINDILCEVREIREI